MGQVNNQCDGHCETCNINQRTYCAAQIAYYNQKEIEEIKKMIQTSSIADLPCVARHDNDALKRETADAEQGENLKTEVL